MGVSFMLEEIASRTPDVVRILPDLPAFEVPLWLVTHRELRTSRRIRLVFDILIAELARLG
jgi:DNA-binding transcriptional LysR family regulator